MNAPGVTEPGAIGRARRRPAPAVARLVFLLESLLGCVLDQGLEDFLQVEP